MIGKYKVNDSCPYCNSSKIKESRFDDLEIIYICGSSGNRESGKYYKQCNRKVK